MAFWTLIVGCNLHAAERATFHGIRAGLNLSTLHNEYEGFNFDYKFGPSIGYFRKYFIGNHVSLQFEIGYTNKGEKNSMKIYSDHTLLYHNEYTITMHYAELPILFSYQFGKLGVLLGPGIGVFLAGKTKYEDKSPGERTHSFESKLEDINRADIGLILGGYYYFELFGKNLLFDFRYNRGMTNINKNTDYYIETKEMHRVFSFTIGYVF